MANDQQGTEPPKVTPSQTSQTPQVPQTNQTPQINQTPQTPQVPQNQQANPVNPNPNQQVTQNMPQGATTPPKKSKWWMWAILIAGVLIFLGIAAYFIFR